MDVSMAGSARISTRPTAQQFFTKVDANGDGGIDKAELKTMVANGPQGAQRSADIDKIFAEVDANGDGTIDETENANQMEKIGQEMQARMGTGGPSGGGGLGGAGGASGGGGPGGAGGGTAATSSSDTTTYDPKDTNQDGTVSLQEEMQYALTQLGSSEDTQASSSASSSERTLKIVDALMKRIEKETKYSPLGTTSVGAGGTPTLVDVRA